VIVTTGWQLCNFLSRSGLISLAMNRNFVLYISTSSKTTFRFTSILGTEIISFSSHRRGRVRQVTDAPKRKYSLDRRRLVDR
jgi:hypothetical protein